MECCLLDYHYNYLLLLFKYVLCLIVWLVYFTCIYLETFDILLRNVGASDLVYFNSTYSALVSFLSQCLVFCSTTHLD